MVNLETSLCDLRLCHMLEIVTVSRNTWSKVSSFEDDACSGAVTALALSANGAYLASACKSGLFIWATSTRRVLLR